VFVLVVVLLVLRVTESTSCSKALNLKVTGPVGKGGGDAIPLPVKSPIIVTTVSK
jgi:hypothetical protein